MSIIERRKLFEIPYNNVISFEEEQQTKERNKVLIKAIHEVKEHKCIKLYRKHLLLNIIKKHLNNKNTAASKIQRWYRNWKKFYSFRCYCESILINKKIAYFVNIYFHNLSERHKINIEQSAIIIQRCFRKFMIKKMYNQNYQDRLNAIILIQRVYRQILEKRKQYCISRGIDPMDKCPITHVSAYMIPIEKQLEFNMGEFVKVCDLVSYLKWISQFDFSEVPTHFWNVNMTQYEFDNILKFGEVYIQSLEVKMHHYQKLHNQKLKTDIDYNSIYLKWSKSIHKELIKNEELIINIKEINYYRCHQHKKLEELENNYKTIVEDIKINVFRLHPMIMEQVISNRSITLMDSYTLSQCYKYEFLKDIEKRIAKYEDLRQYIDGLYKKFGMTDLIQSKKITSFENSKQVVLPSAPPPM
jgi:hypothetical protein